MNILYSNCVMDAFFAPILNHGIISNIIEYMDIL